MASLSGTMTRSRHPTQRATALLWLALALALSLLFTGVTASSSRPLPLKRLAHISDVDITLLSRQEAGQSPLAETHVKREQRPVSHSDRLRLSFRAFEQLFHLHLEPNNEIVPESGATVRYVRWDPVTGQDIVTRTETVHRPDVRAYHGVVVHSDYTHQRLLEDKLGLRRDIAQFTESDAGVMGPASIMLHDDGFESSTPRFEGTFTWAGNEHTIQLPLNYDSSRQEHDPVVEKRALSDGTLVVHRFSDRMNEGEAHALGVRDLSAASAETGCHADDFTFNKQSMDAMDSPFSFFAMPEGVRLGRRSSPMSLSSIFGSSSSAGELGKRAASYVDSALNSFDARTPRYSYEAALVKRQGDVLGGSNNDSFVAHIGSTQGCPIAPRVVYMGIASDCTYTSRFADDSETRVHILGLMNDVSNIYRETFRVALGVVDIEVREASDCPASGSSDARWNRPCSDGYGLDQRLSDFSAWRGSNPANGTGLWHLLTSCSSGSEVGVAWLGTLCKTDASSSGGQTVTGAGVSSVTQREAQVVAHEIGHNFGAIHDCVAGCSISGQTARQNGGAICCPRTSSSCDTGASYVMSPVSQSGTETFSPCSIGNICSMLGRGLDTSCVNDPTVNPRETLSIQQCGNGILEPGEECDAGPEGSNCCTTSCQLREGAVCDAATASCCTDSCQFAPASTVCRDAIDERCDTAETCTGTSAECPADDRLEDGASCGDGLTCATGHCTSRDQQCQQQSQADYSFTSACSPNADQSCSVSCQNPDNPQQCLVLQQQFIDGTSCGYGGRCQGGECRSGSWQNEFRGWYENNLQISIPVTIVIAIVALAIIYGLLRCLCLPCIGRMRGRPVRGARGPVAKPQRRSRSSRASMFQNGAAGAAIQPPPRRYDAYGNGYGGPPNGYGGGYDSYSSSPNPIGQDSRQSRSNWVDPYAYNGHRSSGRDI